MNFCSIFGHEKGVFPGICAYVQEDSSIRVRRIHDVSKKKENGLFESAIEKNVSIYIIFGGTSITRTEELYLKFKSFTCQTFQTRNRIAPAAVIPAEPIRVHKVEERKAGKECQKRRSYELQELQAVAGKDRTNQVAYRT